MSLSVRDILKVYGIKATKRLSQNFIVKKRITDEIVRKIDSAGLRGAFVLEVGPGPGLLTRSILDANAKRVVVVEKDARFLPALQQLASNSNGRLVVIHGDILTIPHEQILAHYYQLKPTSTPRVQSSEVSTDTDAIEEIDSMFTKTHFVGNLPFGISTILLIRYHPFPTPNKSWIQLMNSLKGIFTLPNIEMTLMFQKEVSDGICAAQHQHPRSRLSILSQALFNVSEQLILPPQAFLPAPKVSASVLKFLPREGVLEGVPFGVFEEVVKVAFGAKNKLLMNSLGYGWCWDGDFRAHVVDWKGVSGRVGVPDGFKARSVSVSMFRDIARDLHENGIEIRSKEEIKILMEGVAGDYDNLKDINVKQTNRLINKMQRRESAQKKVEAKLRKADMKLLTVPLLQTSQKQ